MIAILQLACAALIAAVVSSAKVPADVCFTETRRCCFKYQKCGHETKIVRSTVACPFRKCERVCEPHCQAASSLHLEERCTTNEHGKRECKNVPIVEKSGSCTEVCEDKCITVPGTCVQTQTMRYYKFCANLSCGLPSGNKMQRPPVVTDRKSPAVTTVLGKPRIAK